MAKSRGRRATCARLFLKLLFRVTFKPEIVRGGTFARLKKKTNSMFFVFFRSNAREGAVEPVFV